MPRRPHAAAGSFLRPGDAWGWPHFSSPRPSLSPSALSSARAPAEQRGPRRVAVSDGALRGADADARREPACARHARALRRSARRRCESAPAAHTRRAQARTRAACWGSRCTGARAAMRDARSSAAAHAGSETPLRGRAGAAARRWTLSALLRCDDIAAVVIDTDSDALADGARRERPRVAARAAQLPLALPPTRRAAPPQTSPRGAHPSGRARACRSSPARSTCAGRPSP